MLDRYGPRRVNATLLLAAAAGGAWFASTGSIVQLTLARALIGLGVSGCLMSSFSAFALWYPAERLATMPARSCVNELVIAPTWNRFYLGGLEAPK